MMQIDHVHFYVADAQQWQDWFVRVLGFHPVSWERTPDHVSAIVQSHAICCRLSSPIADTSPVADYLRRHPAGVADIAFRVSDLTPIVQRASRVGAKLLEPVRVIERQGCLWQTACIQGWGDLQHTLVAPYSDNLGSDHWVGDPNEFSVEPPTANGDSPDQASLDLLAIDHVVLNVGAGDLEAAVAWYETLFGFQPQQSFAIRTDRSALCSRVLTSGAVQFPINEPASERSQIQEFLDLNRGAGIQHIALRCRHIVPTVAQLRHRGLGFLAVPQEYYRQLRQRPGFRMTHAEQRAIAEQEILVDWQPSTPQAFLLQTFTQPIFDQPTFFFEIIERRSGWINQEYRLAQGFGEGNFRALFEAIEREQIKRGSL